MKKTTTEQYRKMYKRYGIAGKYLRAFFETHKPPGSVDADVFIICRDRKLEIVESYELQKNDIRLLSCSASDVVQNFSIQQWDTLVVEVLNLAHVLKLKDTD